MLIIIIYILTFNPILFYSLHILSVRANNIQYNQSRILHHKHHASIIFYSLQFDQGQML